MASSCMDLLLFGNILIAVVIYVYQTEGKYSLLVVWLLSIVMVIML